MNIKIAHYDDGKKKYQSHEIKLKEENFYNSEYDIFSHDIFDVTGYGETKEEALKDFMKKMNYIFEELKSLEKTLFETDLLTDNMIEVDCFGKEIVNSNDA